MNKQTITFKNIQVHNLKGIDLSLSKHQLVVCTGVSGSGKSSFAFDTLCVEGQRRYVESLTQYARKQIGDLKKPKLDLASGLTPTISIEQKTAGVSPRSTVATMTEIYDHLRLLFAKVAIPHCPVSGEPVTAQSKKEIIETILSSNIGASLIILSPFAKEKKGEFREDFEKLLRQGYVRARINGEICRIEEAPTLDGSKAHTIDIVIDRTTSEKRNLSRLKESITHALEFGLGICSILNLETKEESLYSEHAFSQQSGLSYPELEPQDFSFNSPKGMCTRCHGMGHIREFDLNLVIDEEKSIFEDCCSIAGSYETVRWGNIYQNLARLYKFSVKTPWKKLSEEAKQIFLNGTPEDKWLQIQFTHPKTGKKWRDWVKWKGVLYNAHKRYADATSDLYKRKVEKQMSHMECPSCKGTRLKSYPRAAKLGGKTISELTEMDIADLCQFFTKLKVPSGKRPIAAPLIEEIIRRTTFLLEVGLHYLALNRAAPTLSGGEAQRVRLASQIGGGLVGITYVLDEPSIGLHPRDNTRLIQTLHHLRDLGNTVIVVEHDEETIFSADTILDFGPGPGKLGGTIVHHGDLSSLLKNKKSVTASYLTGALQIPIPKKRRKPTAKKLTLKKASHHNLKNIDVEIPLGLFISVTGVSGSGKSTLIYDTLYPALANALHHAELPIGKHKKINGLSNVDKVIAIDQSPIGRNPRSNPSTYIKVFDDIRSLFTQIPESKARGYMAGRFSFNVAEGSCPNCSGMGMIKVDMDFLEDEWVDCDLCHGKRFDEETLSVKFKEKSIYDILEMSVSEANQFFETHPTIHHKLTILEEVGMGYIKLGQSSTTLSGGEAQRIKLARHLVRPESGNTIYLLDEPTTGLHFHDIKHLLELLQKLVSHGNTVLVIEHNMEVVKTADWILDLGPEGGDAGGELVAAGPPEKIAKMKTPTGKAIKEALSPKKRPTTKKFKPRNRAIESITVTSASQNNLKDVSLKIPRKKITVCTGPSGSGKSSLAFDTLYAEGQRRYSESLSPYARQFVKQMPKPIVESVEGLSPAIAIEQKAHAGNPRSTVGTQTEIYDYLRILFARLGMPHCPETGEKIEAISKEHVVEKLLTLPEKTKIHILAPLSISNHTEFLATLTRYHRQGFLRIRLDGKVLELENLENIPFEGKRIRELFLVIDRTKCSSEERTRLLEGIDAAAKIGKGIVVVQAGEKDLFFNLSFSVPSTGKSYPPITTHTFSFNTIEGMCPYCEGLGMHQGTLLEANETLLSLSPTDLMEQLWGYTVEPLPFDLLRSFLEKAKIPLYTPIRELTPKQQQHFFEGDPKIKIKLGPGTKVSWRGVSPFLRRACQSKVSFVRRTARLLFEEVTCTACNGARIHPLARNVTIHKKGIHNACAMPIEELHTWLKTLKLRNTDKTILDEVLKQLKSRLQFLIDVGLGYLSLDRSAPTLSGGEAQRIRLARQLGTTLTGVFYVLDEPSIGLHPADTDRVLDTLQKLKELENTILIVEHDKRTIESADHIIDFGPGSGERGGEVTAQGTYKQILASKNSLTGAYLSGKESIPVPKKRRDTTKRPLRIQNASLHNLKKINLAIPYHAFTCLTGVSGAGKSTLIQNLLYPAAKRAAQSGEEKIKLPGGTLSGLEHYTQVLFVDQNPVGHTNRSDVGTYVDTLTSIRHFFAKLPHAAMRGLEPKHFSYNHRAGMCTQCFGLGRRKIEMHFMPPVTIECDACHGNRLNPISLEVMYEGMNYGEILNLTVTEVKKLFSHSRKVTNTLSTLEAVGLDYLKIGQSTATLSGGEAQRIKLSRELIKRSPGPTLYLMDEPTTGLHPDDIKKLLKVFQLLVDDGHTLIVIEHNLDLIAQADHLIELGPKAGAEGGYVVAEGTPEQVAKKKGSPTGKFLRDLL